MNLSKDLLRLTSILVFVVACHMAKTAGTGFSSFDSQGHRGCRGLFPENTIPAMKAALNMGVTTLEMDVVISKDRQVVLSHEPFMSHEITTKPDGGFIDENNEKSFNIYQMTYADVIQYDVGLKPHPRFPGQEKIKVVKPLLRDLIDSVELHVRSSGRQLPFYNIETKCLPVSDNLYHPPPAEFVELLMSVIREKNLLDRVIIQSFDFRTLQYLHQHYPTVKTAMLIEEDDTRSFDQLVQALGFTPTIYSPHFSMVNSALVEKCHTQNIKIIPWTVNDRPAIERLKSLGVDGIISDYPDLF